MRLTSIVIVTYNRLEQTRVCVDSIVACTPEPYELVFVDNASADGTVEYLRQRFPNQTVIANEANEGFLRGANRGISASHGYYVVLLNNDTRVTPGWLPALQQAVQTQDVGIASGKIVGPDGRVQLAGAYIAFDGSARMIGEGLSPDDPALATEREVCYVGGHCMLIKREVLDAIGPLEESYGFGYHEDTDYCYRSREAGFKVVYTPGCVVHHELFGTPLPERQAIIQQNLKRFMDRWGGDLFLKRYIRPRVDFRASALELPVGAGWYAAEPEYTCTSAGAWCYLRPVGEPSILELVVSAPQPDLATCPLHLEVRIGSQTIGSTFLTTPWKVEQLFFPLPEAGSVLGAARELDWTGRARPVRIELRVSRTYRPDELFQDGRDPREIGVAVYRMSIGTVAEAQEWAKDGIGVDESTLRLREHMNFLEKAIAEKDAFYARELDGKEQLIARLQGNLEHYHSTPPFRLYFGLKRLLRR